MLQAQDRDYPAQKVNRAEVEAPGGHQPPGHRPLLLEFPKFLLLCPQSQGNSLFPHFVLIFKMIFFLEYKK